MSSRARKQQNLVAGEMGGTGPAVHATATNDSRGVRLLSAKRRRVLCRCTAPDNPMALARKWKQLSSAPAQLFEVIKHCAAMPTTVPLVVAGIRWPHGVEVAFPNQLVDLQATAAKAGTMLPHGYYVLLRAMGGAVGNAAAMASAGSLILRHAMRVRRPDLFWLTATCQVQIAAARAEQHVQTAIESTWAFHTNTVALQAFSMAVKSVEARFATPGTDIIVAGHGMSTSIRDKTLIALALIWGAEHAWHDACPVCAPTCIRRLCHFLQQAKA